MSLAGQVADLERKVAALEAIVGALGSVPHPGLGRPGLRLPTAYETAHNRDRSFGYEGPYGYGSQDR